MTDIEIGIEQARGILGELADRAASGDTIHLTRRGRRIAAIVPQEATMQTLADIARSIADDTDDTYDEVLTTVTAYAIQLGVDTGTQEGGQAPTVAVDAETVKHIRGAYTAA